MGRLAAGLLAGLVVCTAQAQAQEALRPEVGKPLQAAQELIKAQKYKDALAKVRDADAVPGKSANESLMVERMRIAAASGAGDVETAAKAFEVISASGKVSAADKSRMIESIAGSYYRAGNYAKALQWSQRYLNEGGTNPAIRTLLIQSQYLSGDYAGAAKELTTEIQAAEKNGTPPGEDRLKLLLNAALKLGDNDTYVYTVEKLVTYYPKKEYWVDLLSRMQRKPGFSDRLSLDAYRLSLATGSMSAAAYYMEMAQLSVQAGFAAEAKQVLDKGFAAGVLGAGTEGARHKRLRDLVDKKLAEAQAAQAQTDKEAGAAKDGAELVKAGFNQVFAGQGTAGLARMQQGLAQGVTKHPNDAKLHLGVAYWLSGDVVKAQSTFKTVSGTDGTADLARLWSLFARRKA